MNGRPAIVGYYLASMFVIILALGGAVIFLWSRLREVTAQLAALAREQRKLSAALQRLEPTSEQPAGDVERVQPAPRRPAVPPLTQTITPVPAAPPLEPPGLLFPARSEVPPPASPAAPELPEPVPSRVPVGSPAAWSRHGPDLDSFNAGVARVIEFFTTGNIVAKVGMIIVFFGVAFLLRYAAERGMLPIEYRLMGTAAGAVGLLAIGWRLRRSRPEYAVVLQGGAVGVLYLTIFAAFRLYALLPATLTFTLLLIVVAFSAVLAVAQNAMSLAVLGTTGGFLAPILASTGAGSHVTLFSYYAVLTAGVVGIAWFRAWRFLNWLAFVFTFGIGFAWGQQYYQPALFSTTEPFLILFFLLFVAVAVLFAHRQPPQLRGYIDGSLVFGTPAVAFGMQSVLVSEMPLARAYSAVVLSALYLALGRLLWRRDQLLRPLAEAFLALAIVFVIIAVPFAFDGHSTAAAWALEGAGLVWIGIRQKRRLARIAGVGLLLAGGYAFAVMAAAVSPMPLLNSRFLGSCAVAIGGVAGARMLWRGRDVLTERERPLEWVLLAWGLVWWFAALAMEAIDHAPARLMPSVLLLTLAGGASLIGLLARRWTWPAMMLATIPIGPITWAAALFLFVIHQAQGPLADVGWLAWSAALAINYALLVWFERVWPAVVAQVWHVAAAWVVMFLVTWSLAVAVRQQVAEGSIWSSAVWCLTPGMFVLALQTQRRSERWPFRPFPLLYTAIIPAAPVVAMLLWVVWACVHAGAPAPLPYVPLLNPLELTQACALVIAYGWSRDAVAASTFDTVRPVFRSIGAALAFLAVNATVARTVHFFAGVPFDVDALMGSAIFQTGISILWGVTAGMLMTIARRQSERAVWVVGAGLLAVLILKLFTLDLGNVDGIARIVSFLVTGAVILLIGYFAPVPPRTLEASQEQIP